MNDQDGYYHIDVGDVQSWDFCDRNCCNRKKIHFQGFIIIKRFLLACRFEKDCCGLTKETRCGRGEGYCKSDDECQWGLYCDDNSNKNLHMTCQIASKIGSA